MKLDADIREVPLKKIVFGLLILGALTGLGFGGWAAYQKISSRPLTPEQTRSLVTKYLQKQSGKDEFKASVDVSKEKNPWQTLKSVYDAPPDYKTVYRAIGEHLQIAENLLQSSEERDRQNGMRIIAELLDVANDVAYDPWLEARIADGYLLPNADKIGDNPKRGLTAEQIYHFAGKAYRNAEEDDKLIELSKSYLAKYSSSSRADDIRRRLAFLLQSKGKQKEAQMYLAQIKSSQVAEKANRKMGNAGQTDKPKN